jgi:hypothetical protein
MVFASVWTIGCSSDTTDGSMAPLTCEAPYQPFDAANYQSQIERVAAYEQIVAIRKSDDFAAEDFTSIANLYETTAGLRDKVSSRIDEHQSASITEVGADLDAAIMDAISKGTAGEEIPIQGQVVDKTLQRFFFLSVFHEMMASQEPGATQEDIEAGWDEAFGYFGLSNDGQTASGIAKTMHSRDEEFGLSLTSQIYNGLIEGRCAVADGDAEGAREVLEGVDTALLRGFAASVVHEMDEFSEDPLEKGWEGFLYWNIVADHVRMVDADGHATVVAEFDKGVESIDPAMVRSVVNNAFGLGL